MRFQISHLVCGILLVQPTSSAWSQTETSVDVLEIEKEPEIEKIQVTGSRIKRIEIEGSTPLTIIDREDIESRGVISVGDLFRKSALASPIGNFSGSSGYIASGSSTIDLLGLGGDRTLVLLNGKRLPAMAGGGVNAVNVDNIPVGLIERIEILTGGASAIYGADAVGGVVNIVMRKSISGSEVSAFRSITQEGGNDETEINGSFGTELFSDFHIAVTAGYRSRSRLYGNNREISFGESPRDYTSTNPPEGTYSFRPYGIADDGKLTALGSWTPSENCPVANQVATVPDAPDNVYCAGRRAGIPDENVPRKQEFHGALFFDYSMNTKWNLSGFLNGHQSNNYVVQGHYLSSITDPYSNRPVTLTADKARDLGMEIGDEYNFVQLYSKSFETPDRKSRTINKTLGGTSVLEGEFGSWNVQFGASYFNSQGSRRGVNYINSMKLHNIVGDVNPLWIAIDPNRDNSLLYDVFSNLESREDNTHQSFEAFVGSELLNLGGGQLSAGIGASHSAETYEQSNDPNDVFLDEQSRPLYTGSFSSFGNGRRDVNALYGEFRAPFTGNFDVDGAVRMDSYSDFGDSVNYGLGTKIQFIPGVALRGKVATSYKAPPLSYIHRQGTSGYFTIRDEVNCQREIDANRTCDPSSPTRQLLVGDSGNKDLEPETGLSQTLGLVIEPFAGINFLADFYAIDLKNTYEQDDLQDIADGWYRDNPGSTSGGTYLENTVAVDGDGVITRVDQPYRNLGKTRVRAASLQANLSDNIGALRLGLSSRYFRMLSFKVQETTDLPQREQIGYRGYPAWRANNRISFKYLGHAVNLASNTIAGQTQDPDTATNANLGVHIDQYTEFDLNYAWETPWDSRLTLGVNNLLNTIGGIYNGTFNQSESVDTFLYSYNGRTFFARLTQRF